MTRLEGTPRSMGARRRARLERVMRAAIVIALPLPLVVSTPAFASSEGGSHTMELVWQGLNLALLIGVLFWVGRGPVMSFFGDRRSQIQRDLDEAARLLSEAETRNAELQRCIVDLGSEIEEIRENTRARTEEETERLLAEAHKAAERIRVDAAAAVDQELRRARNELREEAANLALDAAADLLRNQVSDGDRERLMDEFITRVEPGGNNG